jgi:hypothetical protein
MSDTPTAVEAGTLRERDAACDYRTVGALERALLYVGPREGMTVAEEYQATLDRTRIESALAALLSPAQPAEGREYRLAALANRYVNACEHGEDPGDDLHRELRTLAYSIVQGATPPAASAETQGERPECQHCKRSDMVTQMVTARGWHCTRCFGPAQPAGEREPREYSVACPHCRPVRVVGPCLLHGWMGRVNEDVIYPEYQMVMPATPSERKEDNDG